MTKRKQDKAFHALANPVARAAHRAKMQKWMEKRLAQIDGFKPGDDCAEFLAATLDELAVCLKAVEDHEVPEWVLADLMASVNAAQDMANHGAFWKPDYADVYRSALTCAVQINCRMPFERVAVGSKFAREGKQLVQVAAAEVAAALEGL